MYAFLLTYSKFESSGLRVQLICVIHLKSFEQNSDRYCSNCNITQCFEHIIFLPYWCSLSLSFIIFLSADREDKHCNISDCTSLLVFPVWLAVIRKSWQCWDLKCFLFLAEGGQGIITMVIIHCMCVCDFWMLSVMWVEHSFSYELDLFSSLWDAKWKVSSKYITFV